MMGNEMPAIFRAAMQLTSRGLESASQDTVQHQGIKAVLLLVAVVTG